VGVQVRIAGAGVAVGERHRQQPSHVDLPHATGSELGVSGVLVRAQPFLLSALDALHLLVAY